MSDDLRKQLHTLLDAQKELGLREVPARWLDLIAADETPRPQDLPPGPAASTPAPPPSPATPAPSPPADGVTGGEMANAGDLPFTLDELRTVALECRKCGLCETRTQVVFGVGNPDAELMFVGEAPGADEDRQGEPFVGAAGRKLNEIITKGFKMQRSEVYIANVLKCRPPNNRDPRPDEIAHCRPYLERQIELIRPKVICALGAPAARTLLNTDGAISRLRGRFHDYRGIPVMPTYHPAYLLRSPGQARRPMWEDVQQILQLLAK